MELLIETAKQVPALVVLGYLTKFFLAAMSEARRDYLHQLDKISQEHFQARNEARIAVESNSEALREFSISMQRLADAVSAFRRE